MSSDIRNIIFMKLQRWQSRIHCFLQYACIVLSISACGGTTGLASDIDSGDSRTSSSIAALPLHELPQFTGDFDEYREQTRGFLQQRSMPHRSEADIELNLPFELRANSAVEYRGKFLLLHGLNDSPYVWIDIANELVERGFDVRAPLFEGHGSTPKAMLEVSYQDWLDTARQHLHGWQEANVPMFIGGFSMGGVIATLLALENPGNSENSQKSGSARRDNTDSNRLAGLLLVSPAFHSRLNHYLRWSGIYARFKPWVFGGMILEDNPIKYNSIPVNSGWQFYKTTRVLKKKLRNRKLDLPVLMINSANDSVVDTSVTRNTFRRHFTSDRRKLLTYHESPVPKSNLHEEFRLSTVAGTRVLNQSHLGLMYSPDNPLFGKDGSILVCNGNEYPIFMACMNARNHWFGAQHTESPDGTAVARITYNPDFSHMMTLIEQVLLP